MFLLEERLLNPNQSGFCFGKLYNLLESYLSVRLQNVVLNEQRSSLRPVLAGVPQGSFLGQPFFLININDLRN